jgi:hypothetical protein
MITNPFRNRQLRDWLCHNVDPAAIGLKAVSTSGSGPFEEAEFDDFLRRSGITPRTIASGTKVLVIGRREWSESALRTLIKARSGMKLRVYSQEMFIAFLLTGNDPLDSPSDVVERWGKGHPALTFLSEVVGFDWPTTVVHGGGGSELQADWLERGFLKYLGYVVGRSGGSEDERHEVLRKAYTTQRLPSFFPPDYRSEWGRPRSSVVSQAHCTVRHKLGQFSGLEPSAPKSRRSGNPVIPGPLASVQWAWDTTDLWEQTRIVYTYIVPDRLAANMPRLREFLVVSLDRCALRFSQGTEQPSLRKTPGKMGRAILVGHHRIFTSIRQGDQSGQSGI